jgi:DNA-binding transcriptional regulator PaaX
MAIKLNYYRRHTQEWLEFFSDTQEFAAEAVNYFIRRHKKKKYLRQALNRLMERGLIKEDNGKFLITQVGLRFFKKFQLKIKNKASKPDLLKNKRWILISFDVPVRVNYARQRIRALLKEFDFYPIHKSVWINPYAISKDFLVLLAEGDLEKYCKIMIVELIEVSDDIKKRFRLK